ncbi:MAG: chemotaxis protein CheW [Chloroflexota bacterium]|nr:chemotaxis protein CheW [Chloroflexota bacterium]
MSSNPVLEVLVVGVDSPHGGGRQRYGLLVGQVHSIVRIDETESGGRLRGGPGGWELVYEDGWVPLRHLRDSIGLSGSQRNPLAGQVGAARVLGVRRSPDQTAGPRYIGFVVDEVIEIRSLLLGEVLPFPRWVIHHLPPSTVWGALHVQGEGDHALLLLLDGMALAGQVAGLRRQVERT